MQTTTETIDVRRALNARGVAQALNALASATLDTFVVDQIEIVQWNTRVRTRWWRLSIDDDDKSTQAEQQQLQRYELPTGVCEPHNPDFLA